jgi:hypothetical protein
MPRYPAFPNEKQLIAKTVKRTHEESKAKRENLANEDRLALLEGIIERGFQTFLEVGQALKEIKDQKLWKPRYVSFEEYCHARWKWGLRYSNKVIQSSEIAYTVGPPYPANEGIARELAKLIEQDEERGKPAWAEFIKKNPHPTAKETRAFVRDFLKEGHYVEQPFPPANPPNEFTARTLAYLKNMESNFAERAERERFLDDIYHYMQDRRLLSIACSAGLAFAKPGARMHWIAQTKSVRIGEDMDQFPVPEEWLLGFETMDGKEETPPATEAEGDV